MHHRASIDLHRTVEKSILTILLHTNTYQAIYTLCLQTNREKSWPIRSLLACEPSGWSLFFEWNSYKVHSYVSVWFLNAKKKKKVWTTGSFLFSKEHYWPPFEKSKVQAGRLSLQRGEATSHRLAKSSNWLHWTVPGGVNAFTTLASLRISTSLAVRVCEGPGPGAGPYRSRSKELPRNCEEQTSHEEEGRSEIPPRWHMKRSTCRGGLLFQNVLSFSPSSFFPFQEMWDRHVHECGEMCVHSFSSFLFGLYSLCVGMSSNFP